MMLLLVEDDASTREALEMVLTDEGHRVVSRWRGGATVLGGQERFDAAMLDINVPGAPVEVLVQTLRARLPELPIVLCSASPQLVALASALECEALAKPFEIDAVLETLARARARHHRDTSSSTPLQLNEI